VGYHLSKISHSDNFFPEAKIKIEPLEPSIPMFSTPEQPDMYLLTVHFEHLFDILRCESFPWHEKETNFELITTNQMSWDEAKKSVQYARKYLLARVMIGYTIMRSSWEVTSKMIQLRKFWIWFLQNYPFHDQVLFQKHWATIFFCK